MSSTPLRACASRLGSQNRSCTRRSCGRLVRAGIPRRSRARCPSGARAHEAAPCSTSGCVARAGRRRRNLLPIGIRQCAERKAGRCEQPDTHRLRRGVEANQSGIWIARAGDVQPRTRCSRATISNQLCSSAGHLATRADASRLRLQL